MEGANIGEISLNLLTDAPSFSKSRNNKGKHARPRGQFTKDQEGEKVTIEKERDKANSQKQIHGERKEKRKNPHSGDDDERAGGGGPKRKKSGENIISSLFRKNPDIPVVPRTEVAIIQENVFTGQTFKDLPIHPFLVSNLEERQGFTQMTEVQRRAIPVLLNRQDVLIKSQTGSGKTLAYAVPIIQSLLSRVVKVRRDDGPYAVVILPTRELALQTYNIFLNILRAFVWIVPGCLMGGEKKKAEKARLRKGVNILVATPGRLMDHIKTTSVLSLRRILWLVIDEADRLLELGYEKDIAEIINVLKSQCPDPPQTVLLSATMSEGVENLSSITMEAPCHIDVSDISGDRASHIPSQNSNSKLPSEADDGEKSKEKYSLPSQLKQFVIITPCKLRLVLLASFILWKCKPRGGVGGTSKMIVFLSTQDSVMFHFKLFTQVLTGQSRGKKDGQGHDSVDSDGEEQEDQEQKLRIYCLHGNMDQKARSETFVKFAGAMTGIMLCTDVAARGLDLPHVDWIVQYTSPGSTVDYIHRVGRTARAGTSGQSLLFLMPAEAQYVQNLNDHGISVSQLEPSSILKPLLANLGDLPAAKVNTKRESPRTVEEAATYLQDRLEECVLACKDMHGLAGKGFQSYIRAYAAYSREVKPYFKVNDLHLGHVSKSFALREPPSKVHSVASSGGGQRSRRQERPKAKPLSFKQATLSEYSSGLGGKKNRSTGVNAKVKHKKQKSQKR